MPRRKKASKGKTVAKRKAAKRPVKKTAKRKTKKTAKRKSSRKKK